MSSYDDEKTNLKSIFGDNKYPNGKNFAELINLPDFKLAENNDGTITINNVTYDMTKSDLGSIAQISEDFNNLPNGLTFVSFGQNNAPEPTRAYWVRTFSSSAYNGRKLQVAQADVTNNRYIRISSGTSWNNWDSLATGSDLNNGLANKVTDNKDGSITVNGATFIPANVNDLPKNLVTEDQLATKADTSAIDPGVMVKRALTATDDVLALDPGTYYVWGSTPKNYPTNASPDSCVVVREFSVLNGNQLVEVFDAWGNQLVNIQTGPSTWSGWQVPNTGYDANFTGKLQKSGIDVATITDVKNAVNAITSNSINWTSLSVDSSQISDTDYSSNNTNCSYRISHNTLYISGQYVMNGNSSSSHNSKILFTLPTNIVRQISFPSMNKFTIGLLQALSQQPLMMSVYLTSDGKITCATDPYDVSTTSGAIMASGFINAAIPLN